MILLNTRRWWRRCAPPAVAVAAALQLACNQEITPPPLPSSALGLEDPAPASGQSARRIAPLADGNVGVPPTAMAGQPVRMTVTTYAGGCTAGDTTVVAQYGMHADVVPYQRVYNPRPNEECTADLVVDPRLVELTFPQQGIATVIVYGRTSGGSLIVVAREVMVK